jgi:acetyl-CoA/propionyl-CoA carboxylase biotin carboxyl carrier protein
VVVIELASENVFLEIDGEELRFALGASGEGYPRQGRPQSVYVGNDGWSCRLEVLTRESRLARVLAAIQREEGAADPEVRSPMPGTVVSVAVSNGDAVVTGQLLLSVEAMKMEHQLVAEVAGTVHISVKAGQSVKADQVLATIHAEPHAEDPAQPGPALQEPLILQDPLNTGKGA